MVLIFVFLSCIGFIFLLTRYCAGRGDSEVDQALEMYNHGDGESRDATVTVPESLADGYGDSAGLSSARRSSQAVRNSNRSGDHHQLELQPDS